MPERELESQFRELFCDLRLLVTVDKSTNSNVKWKCPQRNIGDGGTEAFMTCSLIVSPSGECQLNG